MKRLIAIVLLSMHLFYAGCYTIIIQYFIHKSDVELSKTIYERGIDAAQLIQVKLPIKTPGFKGTPQYRSLQGQIRLADGYYNYLGVKVTRDTVYLACVANSDKTKWENIKSIVAKSANDIPVNKKGQEQSVKKAAASFECSIPQNRHKFTSFAVLSFFRENLVTTALTHPYIESPGKPPNYIC